MSGRPRAVGAAVVALVALALTGCSASVDGTGRPDPAVTAGAPLGAPGADATPALAQLKTDMLALPHGFAVSFGTGASLSIDARYQGDDGRATVSVSGQACELVGVAHKAWARAGARFWTDDGGVDADRAGVIDGKWVAVEGPIARFSQYVDADGLLTSLTDQPTPVLGATSQVGGRRVQQISITDKVSVQVTLASPHVIAAYGGSAVRFTYPDDDLSVTPPAGAIPFPS